MGYFEADGEKYVDQIRKLEVTDPAHADIFNQLCQTLVNNDLFLKKMTQNMLERITNVDNTADSDKPVSVPVQEALDAYYAQLTAYADKAIADLIDGAPTTLDTLKELANAINDNKSIQEVLDAAIGTKAAKAEFDSHVDTMASSTMAGHVKVDSTLNSNSTNPLQNKVLKEALDNKQNQLGFTPVRQGGGTGQTNNIIRIGWSDSNQLKAQVDNVPMGNIVTTGESNNVILPITKGGTGATSIVGARKNLGLENYETCSTDSVTAAKVVNCTGFTLVTGATIRVKFINKNTASSPTLNINATGAKAIYYRGGAIKANYLVNNKIYEFLYNGTQYELVGDVNTYRIGLYKLDSNWTIDNTVGATSIATAAHVLGAEIGGGGTGVLVNCSLPYIIVTNTAYAGGPYNITLTRKRADSNNIGKTGANDAYVIIMANEV